MGTCEFVGKWLDQVTRRLHEFQIALMWVVGGAENQPSLVTKFVFRDVTIWDRVRLQFGIGTFVSYRWINTYDSKHS